MIDSLTSLGGASTQPSLRVVTPTTTTQPDAGGGQTAAAAPSAASSTTSAAPAPAPPPATRIMVDRSDSGMYVYRLVDVVTGRTLAELPRSESENLKLTSDYTPGAVTATSA